MKQKIKLINLELSSPVLVLEYSKASILEKFIKDFQSASNESNPRKAMVDMIIFASTYGKGIKAKEIFENYNQAAKDNNGEITNVSIREPNIVEFVYKKDSGETNWRTIDVLEEDSIYIKGHDTEDDNKFKCFKKSCIVGGRILKK
jgi:hypothetical protein